MWASDVPHLWACHRGCRQERRPPPPLTSGQRGEIDTTPLVPPPPTRGALHTLLPPQAVFLHQINAPRTQGVKLISATGSLIRRNTSEGLKTCILKQCILYRRTTLLYRGILASGELGVEGVWVYASAFVKSGNTWCAGGTCLSGGQGAWEMRLDKLPTQIPVCSK